VLFESLDPSRDAISRFIVNDATTKTTWGLLPVHTIANGVYYEESAMLAWDRQSNGGVIQLFAPSFVPFGGGGVASSGLTLGVGGGGGVATSGFTLGVGGGGGVATSGFTTLTLIASTNESFAPDSFLAQTNSSFRATTMQNTHSTWNVGFTESYHDLGVALDEMSSADADDNWRIEPSVYHASCNFAAWLMARSVSAPQVFSHGSESVVFNWTNGRSNSYLTISAEGVSTLRSTPERIEFRRDYRGDELSNLISILLPIVPRQLETLTTSDTADILTTIE
jgi:hypothetical protein